MARVAQALTCTAEEKSALVQHHVRHAAHRGVLTVEGNDLFTLFRQDPVSLGHNALRTGLLTRKAGPTVIGSGEKAQDGQGFLDGKSRPFLADVSRFL